MIPVLMVDVLANVTYRGDHASRTVRDFASEFAKSQPVSFRIV